MGCGVAPLNLLVILNTHVPTEVLGEVRPPPEEEIKAKFQPQVALADDGAACGEVVGEVPPGAGWAGGHGGCSRTGAPHESGDEVVDHSVNAWGVIPALATLAAAIGTEPPDRGAQRPSPAHGGDGGGLPPDSEEEQVKHKGAAAEQALGGTGGVDDPGSQGGESNLTEPECQWVCTDGRTSRLRPSDGSGSSSYCAPHSTSEAASLTLVMSYDNIAALVIISSLSVLGAIYLFKICTRRRCSCRICRNQYRVLDLLGSGGYGSVYLVERLPDGERFVNKRIPIREITEVDEYSREAKELVTLRHRHIVSYEEDFVHVEYGALEPKTYFNIIMEYCSEGDLKGKIEVDFEHFTEEYVRTVFAQLLQAVQYLHSKNVIHRDLKSQNVFLALDGRVRLGDFGLCKHTLERAIASATLTHAGTDCYMAPEMLSSSRYGKPADMWSLGCVLYELCTGQFMWELDGILGAMVMKDAHVVQKLVQSNLVPTVGHALTSLMRRLLSVSPAARPTVTECIRKKIFKRSFPLSRVPFGESLGELEATEAEPTRTRSQYSRDEDGGSAQGSSCGGAAGASSETSSSSGDGPLEFVTRNDDLPKRRRRRKRRLGARR